MKSILIVDNEIFDTTIISTFLDDFKLHVAMSGEEAIEQLKSHPIDLVLMDIIMPDMDGYETCVQLKKNPQYKDIPVIFLTGMIDEESIVKAYDSGGVDFINKPIKERELLARINIHLKLSGVIQELEFLSYRDPLTNLYNRRRFFEIFEHKFKQKRTNLVAIMIDIDHFKVINDRYGHSTGDKVISYISNLIADILPDDAVFGRIGGEEFAIVCNRPSADIVTSKMERIRKVITQSHVLTDTNKSVKFTISMGVSLFEKSMQSVDDLLAAADKALYKAKDGGRNRVILRT